MGKEILIERNVPETIKKMPIDFIDQLSKLKKEPYWTSEGPCGWCVY
jgi:hypothetical protein